MATPGEMVRVLAEVLGLPEATVRDHDANLRAAGLRSKSGRGRGAVQVTARDAACLLTAILGSGQVKDSVRTVQRFDDTRPHGNTSSHGLFAAVAVSELHALPEDHSFIDALAALLASLAAGSLAKRIGRAAAAAKAPPLAVAPQIEVVVLTPGAVGDIRIAGISRKSASVRYALPNPWDEHASMHPPRSAVKAWEAKVKAQHSDADLEQSRRITAKTLLRVASILVTHKDR